MAHLIPDRVTVEGTPYVRAYPVARGLCSHCGRHKPYWTPGRLIATVLLWVERNQRVPTSEEWVRGVPSAPARETPIKVFGRWNHFLRAAGLVPPTRRWWTTEEIVDALVEERVRLGRWPTSHEWERATGTRTKGNKMDRPCAGTVRRRFGSWSAAITEAKGTERRYRLIPAAPIAEAVRAYMADNGSLSLVAELAQIDEALVFKLANGKKTFLREDTAEALATAISRPDVLAA